MRAGPNTGDAHPPAGDPGAGRLVESFRSPGPDRVGWLVVGVAAFAFLTVFGALVVRSHDRFLTFTFDLGIFDQGLWLLSRLHAPYVTLRGLNLFADHSSYVMVLLAPLYWVWADPRVLIAFGTAAVAAGAPLTYGSGRAVGLTPAPAAAVAVAYLLQPAVQWNVWDAFHPEVVVLPLLLAAFLACARRRPWWAVPAVAVALLAKEDVALVVVPFGLFVAWYFGQRRAGLAMAGLGVAAFLINFLVVLPALSPTGDVIYSGRYAAFGRGPFGILWGMLTRPLEVVRRLGGVAHLEYLARLVLPFLAALLAPAALAISIPVILANLLSTHTYQAQIQYHYTTYASVGLTIAALLGTRFLVRIYPRRQALVMTAVLGVALAGAIGAGPRLWGGVWGSASPAQAAVNRALELIPPDAGVSADSRVAAHLAHRTTVYMFPNPFQRVDWGVPDLPYDAEEMAVDWVVVQVDRLASEPALREPLALLLASGAWDTVVEDGYVIVLKRA